MKTTPVKTVIKVVPIATISKLAIEKITVVITLILQVLKQSVVYLCRKHYQVHILHCTSVLIHSIQVRVQKPKTCMCISVKYVIDIIKWKLYDIYDTCALAPAP